MNDYKGTSQSRFRHPKEYCDSLKSIVSTKSCVFCKRAHYSDKCCYVTDIEGRKKVIKFEKICHKCLLLGHFIKDCRNKGKCFKYKSTNHHTAVCEQQRNFTSRKIDNSNSTLLVSATSSVLLQTLDCYILNPAEEKAMQIMILISTDI